MVSALALRLQSVVVVFLSVLFLFAVFLAFYLLYVYVCMYVLVGVCPHVCMNRHVGFQAKMGGGLATLSCLALRQGRPITFYDIVQIRSLRQVGMLL